MTGIKRKYALGATASIIALLGTLTPYATANASSPTYLPLANDKPTWTNQFNAIGKVLAADDGIGWTADPLPSTTNYQALERAAATTSKSPALFTWWSGQQLDPLVQAGALANLTADVKVWEAKYGLNPGVEKAYEVNGQYYAAPLYTSDWIVFYNKTDYAKYHLSVPMTWAQLASNVATLRSNGISPFTYNVDDWAGFIWFEQILDEQDPSAYQALVNGQISYTSAPVVAAMTEWRTLSNDGWFATPTNIDIPTNTVLNLVNGSNAMMLIGSWNEGPLVKAGMVPGKTLGAFFLPPLNPKVGWQAIFETGPVVVSAHSSQESEALASVNTFMEPAVQRKWDTLADFVSAESSVVSTDPTAVFEAKEIKSENINLSNRYWEATPPQIAVAVSSELSKFILNPNLSLTPFLKSLQQIAQSYWSTAKK
jgi:multiple sugar transport system substrate-binding protein